MNETPAPSSSPDVPALLRRLRTAYVAQLAGAIAAVEKDLRALDRSGDFATRFEACYRRVYALKSGAGSYGLPILAKIGHQLEEHLHRLAAEPGEDLLQRCLAHVALMREVQEEVSRGVERFPEVEDRLAELRATLLGPRYSALVVEKSKVNVKLCNDTLKAYPVHVTVVDDGLQALEWLLGQRYHLLITALDVGMLNGLALIAAVRANKRLNHDIQAILVSSSPSLPNFKRDIDPNFTIARDGKFAESLSQAVAACLANVQTGKAVAPSKA